MTRHPMLTRTRTGRDRAAALAVLALVLAAPAAAQQDTVPAQLTLEEAIAIAFRTNPQHLQSLNNIQVEDANVRQAYGALLPDLTVGIRYSSNYSERSTGTGNLGEVLDPGRTIISKSSSSRQFIQLGELTLFDWGTTFRNIDIAKLGRERAEVQIEQAEDQLTATVTQLYYGVSSADTLFGVQQQRLVNAQNRLAQTKKGYTLGERNMSDVLGVELEVAEAEQGVADAADDARGARLDLLQTLGVGGEPPFDVVTPLAEAFDPASLDENDLIARALQQAPSVALNAIDLERQEKNRTNTKYARYPRLALGLPTYSWGRTERGLYDAWGDFLGERNLSLDVGFGMSYNLFDGWTYRHTRMVQEAALVDARHASRQLRLQVENDIRSGLLDLGSAYRSLQNAELRVELERTRLNLGEEQYRRGVIPYTNLETMLQAYDDAQRAVIDARLNFLNTRVNLERQIGGPLIPGG